MDTEPAFGFEQLVMTAVAEIATAVSVRNGEGQQQQRARFQTAAHMIMGFQPRDGIEIMLAGHCTMVHEMMIIDVCQSLRSEPGTNQRTLVALNKTFNDTLDRLERYRQRPAERQRVAPETPPLTAGPAEHSEPAASPVAPEMNRAARRQAARAERHAAAAASRQRVRPDPSPPALYRSNGTAMSDVAVAECRANPEAMAALTAGDPIGFAHALGIATPSEAFLAAARRRGSPFDPQTTGPWPTDDFTCVEERASEAPDPDAADEAT
jgi:hypothetical protein